MMKKKRLNKNKKAQMLSQEVALVIISIALVGLVVFFSFKFVKTSGEDYSISPEISYQYPSVYIHSFLEKEITLTSEQKNETGLDKDKYKIKELLSDSENSKKFDIVKFYKNNYIKENEDSLKKYEQFSNQNIDESFLLKIETKKTSIPNLENEIKNKNYFFYFKDQDNKFVIVYFKNPSANAPQKTIHNTPIPEMS